MRSTVNADLLKIIGNDSANRKYVEFMGDTQSTSDKSAQKQEIVTSQGDIMTAFAWDGPEDSDEEVAEMVPLKNEFEKQQGIRFSKRGIIEYVEAFLERESSENKTDPATAKKWEEKLSTPTLKFYLKNGGSQFNDSQPFLRTNSWFNKKFKMEKIVNCVSKLFV